MPHPLAGPSLMSSTSRIARKRTRTIAPGSQTHKTQKNKPPRNTRSRLDRVDLLHDALPESKLRHTAIWKDSNGRRKQKLSLVPLALTVADDQAEDIELATFQHFLDDNDDWVPDTADGDTAKNLEGKQKKQKKAKPISIPSERESRLMTLF